MDLGWDPACQQGWAAGRAEFLFHFDGLGGCHQLHRQQCGQQIQHQHRQPRHRKSTSPLPPPPPAWALNNNQQLPTITITSLSPPGHSDRTASHWPKTTDHLTSPNDKPRFHPPRFRSESLGTVQFQIPYSGESIHSNLSLAGSLRESENLVLEKKTHLLEQTRRRECCYALSNSPMNQCISKDRWAADSKKPCRSNGGKGSQSHPAALAPETCQRQHTAR